MEVWLRTNSAILSGTGLMSCLQHDYALRPDGFVNQDSTKCTSAVLRSGVMYCVHHPDAWSSAHLLV